MLVQFGNNWMQKIQRTAKLDSAIIWQSSEFFSSNYFQIGQHVVLLHVQSSYKTCMARPQRQEVEVNKRSI